MSKRSKSSTQEVVTRDYTINLHKLIHRQSFKKRAPRAISAIKKFAQNAMGTVEVRIDPSLNQAVWAKGVRNVPYRLRVRLARKRSEEAEGENDLYTLASVVEVPTFKGLQNTTVEEDAETEE